MAFLLFSGRQLHSEVEESIGIAFGGALDEPDELLRRSHDPYVSRHGRGYTPLLSLDRLITAEGAEDQTKSTALADASLKIGRTAVADRCRLHAILSAMAAFRYLRREAAGVMVLRDSDAARRQKVFGARTAVVMSRAMGKAVDRKSTRLNSSH